jgi:hypothetical protein
MQSSGPLRRALISSVRGLRTTPAALSAKEVLLDYGNVVFGFTAGAGIFMTAYYVTRHYLMERAFQEDDDDDDDSAQEKEKGAPSPAD